MSGEWWAPRNSSLAPAYALWRDQQHAKALTAFQGLTAELNDDPDLWRGLGSVWWTLGEHRRALQAFQTALDREPWSPVHWHTVGLALRDMGAGVRAAAALWTAIRLDPGYHPALNELANVHVDCGACEVALPLYDRAIGLDPSPAVYHHNRGVALRLAGRIPEAVASFEVALARDSAYAHSVRELARLRDVR